MKRQIPLLLTFVFGLVGIFFQIVPASADAFEVFNDWIAVMAIFAILIGIASLTNYHLTKIRRKHKDIFFSYVVFVSMITMVIVGVIGYHVPNSMWTRLFNNLYTYLRVPLDSTMFSLLAFYITSAAYRAFRARNWLATVLLVSGIIVMLGRVIAGPWGIFSGLTGWIMTVPNTAAMRAIIIGVGLGSVATSIKIILGIERSYLGGGD